MKLMDKLFRNSRTVAIGKLRYKNSQGETVTVTKGIRYTVKDGNSVVYTYAPNTLVTPYGTIDAAYENVNTYPFAVFNADGFVSPVFW